MILGATNNDTINNRSILNGGVRARMRLHNSESLAPSVCRAFTNVHLSPNYNSGNSQTNSNKNVGSTSTTNTDGTSSNVGGGGGSSSSSSSSSSLFVNSLANGHAISMADKSMVSPGNRRRTFVADARTLAEIRKLAFQDQSPSVSCIRNNFGAEQSSMLKSDSRSATRSEQSAAMPGMCTDARVISRQDKSVLPAAETSSASHTSDPSVSPHADARSVLRIEQPSAVAGGAAFPDSRVMTRPEQSGGVLLADDLRAMRQQPEQTTSIRVNEDLRTMRQQPEQQSATNVRVTEDLRGMRQQSEQSTNIRIGEDLRAMRQQQAEQSTSVRLLDDLRVSRTEQSMNVPLLDQRGVLRGSPQNASIPLTTDGRAASGRSEQSAPLPDGRTIPMAEHMSPAVLPDIRPVPRIPQATGSLPSNQSAAVPVAGQSSVAQPGVLITEDVAHSEEPLPTGWEMRYDVYGRR